MSSFAFVRFNTATQVNVFLDILGSSSTEKFDFDELVLTWNSKRLNRALWKTKKFVNSHTVERAERNLASAINVSRSSMNHPALESAIADFDTAWGHTCFGKCLAYVNKLLQGSWVTEEEHSEMYGAVVDLMIQRGAIRRIYSSAPIKEDLQR